MEEGTLLAFKKSLEFGAILMRTGWMNIILSKARMVTGRNSHPPRPVVRNEYYYINAYL